MSARFFVWESVEFTQKHLNFSCIQVMIWTVQFDMWSAFNFKRHLEEGRRKREEDENWQVYKTYTLCFIAVLLNNFYILFFLITPLVWWMFYLFQMILSCPEKSSVERGSCSFFCSFEFHHCCWSKVVKTAKTHQVKCQIIRNSSFTGHSDDGLMESSVKLLVQRQLSCIIITNIKITANKISVSIKILNTV